MSIVFVISYLTSLIKIVMFNRIDTNILSINCRTQLGTTTATPVIIIFILFYIF